MGGFRVWLELQLGSVHDLNLGYIDWDDNTTGWNSRLGRKLDNGVVLLSGVNMVGHLKGRPGWFLPCATP